MQGWHAKKYANKVVMMHESKGCVLAKQAENSFIDQGEFVARRCSGYKASCCGKHQFCDRMMVRT